MAKHGQRNSPHDVMSPCACGAGVGALCKRAMGQPCPAFPARLSAVLNGEVETETRTVPDRRDHTCTPMEPGFRRTLCDVCRDVLVADGTGGYVLAPTDFRCTVCGSPVKAGECVYHACRMLYASSTGEPWSPGSRVSAYSRAVAAMVPVVLVASPDGWHWTVQGDDGSVWHVTGNQLD